MKRRKNLLWAIFIHNVMAQRIIGPINSDDPKWRTVNAPAEMASLGTVLNILRWELH
jgi:hypothetical protein